MVWNRPFTAAIYEKRERERAEGRKVEGKKSR